MDFPEFVQTTNEYIICMNSGSGFDIFSNHMNMRPGDSCRIDDGTNKLTKCISVQTNEHKARYLVRELTCPSNEYYPSPEMNVLNGLSMDVKQLLETNKKLEHCNNNVQTSEFGTQAEYSDFLNTKLLCESGTQVDKPLLFNTNSVEVQTENQELLKEPETVELNDAQLSVLADCLSEIDNGHIYFYLYLNKRLLPDQDSVKPKDEEVVKMKQWIDHQQKHFFPIHDNEDEGSYWFPLHDGLRRFLKRKAAVVTEYRLHRREKRHRRNILREERQSHPSNTSVNSHNSKTGQVDIIVLDDE